MFQENANSSLLLLLITGTLLVFTTCSDDSTGPEGEDDLGEVTLTVSGDVEGERSGQADFWSLNQTGSYIWDITMHDFNPQTFSLTFMWFSTQEIERPSPGTYTIGGSSGLTVTYTHIENQDFQNALDYTHVLCPDETGSGGEITITSSSDEEMTGSFSVTLANADIDDGGNCVNNGTVQVTGEFRATERIPL